MAPTSAQISPKTVLLRPTGLSGSHRPLRFLYKWESARSKSSPSTLRFLEAVAFRAPQEVPIRVGRFGVMCAQGASTHADHLHLAVGVAPSLAGPALRLLGFHALPTIRG